MFENITPRPYPFNCNDLVRRSHDIRVYEDGEVICLRASGCPSGNGDLTNDEEDRQNEENEDGEDKDERAYVELRVTDILGLKRGRGQAFLKTVYNFDWGEEGITHPESRQIETKSVVVDDDGNTVRIKVIKSIIMVSATNSPSTAKLQRPVNRFQGKRMTFDNSAHDGRVVKIKFSGAPHRTEIIKRNIYNAGKQSSFQGSRFHTPIWGDPEIEPRLYKESGKLTPGGEDL